MGVAPVAGECAEQYGAHDIKCATAAIASVMKRAAAQEFLPASADLEELEEEDQPPFPSDRGLVVPFGVKTSARGVQRPSSGRVF